jgi:pyruvate/2-oxoglutarate dehydrogenase complex dihydrolipoamide acyltransferase (E2) component
MAERAGYRISTLSPFRRQVVDYFVEAQKTPSIRILFELDVTEARASLRRYRRDTGSPLSLSSFLLFAFAGVLGEHRELQGHILRGRRLVVFDDVDVSTIIERRVAGRVVPTSYVIRQAQRKSPAEIEAEVSTARAVTDDALFDVAPVSANEGTDGSRGRRRRNRSPGQLLGRLPRPLRRLAIRYVLRRNPFVKKQLLGTCSFSAAHMFGQGYGYGVPVTPHPIHLLVGGIETRSGDSRATERQIACVTLSLDHNIADAAPAIRFVNEFKRVVGRGLELQ